MHTTTSSVLYSLGLAIAISILPLAALAVQGDPIPGVDVSVDQIPSGIKTASVKTNANGTFATSRLVAGEYLVTVALPKGMTAGSQAVSGNGTAAVTLAIELAPTEKEGTMKPIIIAVGEGGGTVSGVIIEGAPRKGFFGRLLDSVAGVFTSLTDRIQKIFQRNEEPAGEATPTPSATSTPAATASPTRSPSPTVSPTATTPTATATPTPAATASATPAHTATPTPPTPPTPAPTLTPTPTASPTATPNLEPSLQSVVPSSVAVDQQFTLNGSNFTGQIKAVQLNGVGIWFYVLDGQTIFAKPNPDMTSGVYGVRIETVNGEYLTLTNALTIQ